jgi:4-hydroxybenzoate polyprenyltransferase
LRRSPWGEVTAAEAAVFSAMLYGLMAVAAAQFRVNALLTAFTAAIIATDAGSNGRIQ